jgi:hypothetical protein
VVQPLEPGLLQLLQASRVDAAAGEDAARRDGVHGVSGRESVSDLTRHVGSEHELEAAAPVRWNGQHTMRLDRLVTPARTLDHIQTFIWPRLNSASVPFLCSIVRRVRLKEDGVNESPCLRWRPIIVPPTPPAAHNAASRRAAGPLSG